MFNSEGIGSVDHPNKIHQTHVTCFALHHDIHILLLVWCVYVCVCLLVCIVFSESELCDCEECLNTNYYQGKFTLIIYPLFYYALDFISCIVRIIIVFMLAMICPSSIGYLCHDLHHQLPS